jgi:hypothetical protein
MGIASQRNGYRFNGTYFPVHIRGRTYFTWSRRLKRLIAGGMQMMNNSDGETFCNSFIYNNYGIP